MNVSVNPGLPMECRRIRRWTMIVHSRMPAKLLIWYRCSPWELIGRDGAGPASGQPDYHVRILGRVHGNRQGFDLTPAALSTSVNNQVGLCPPRPETKRITNQRKTMISTLGSPW